MVMAKGIKYSQQFKEDAVLTGTLSDGSYIKINLAITDSINVNGKGFAGINAPLTMILSMKQGSQAEHRDALLRPLLIC